MKRALALAGLMLAAGCGQTPSTTTPRAATDPSSDDAAPAAGPTVVTGTCYSTRFASDDEPPTASAVDRRYNVFARPRQADPVKKMPVPAKATVQIVGKPRVHGDIDEAALSKALRRHLSKLRSCYDKALVDSPRLSGTRTITVTVAKNGGVKSVTVTGRDQALGSCIEGALSRVVLPAPSGASATVTFTVRFKPAVSTSSGTRRLPSAPAGCTSIADEAPLVGAVSSLQRCYEIALLDDPTLGGRLDVRIAPSGSVDFAGSFGDPLSGCMRNVLARTSFAIPPDSATVCTLLLDNPLTPPSEDEVRIAIDLADVTTIDGRILDDSDLEGGGLSFTAARALRAIVPEPLDDDPAMRPRLVVRAHPGVDAQKVELVLDELAHATLPSVSFARSVGVTDAWSVVNPIGSPSDAFCRPVETSVSVLVTETGFVVFAGGIAALIDRDSYSGRGADRSAARDGDERDFDALSTAFATIKNMTLPNRSDLSIAAVPGTTYRDLLRVIELGLHAGFFDARHVQHTLLTTRLDAMVERSD